MLQLELPHVNVLSKIDLVEKFGKLGSYSSFLRPLLLLHQKPSKNHLMSPHSLLDANLDLYASGQNLEQLTAALNKNFATKRFKKLNSAICELIDEFGLVSFETLNIQVPMTFPSLLPSSDNGCRACCFWDIIE